MTLTPEPLSQKMSLKMDELERVICDEVATGNLSVAVIAVMQSTIYAHFCSLIKSTISSI